MSAIRVLLVDDEQPARERLRLLLASHDDVEIVGEAEDGEDAIEKILELSPQLVLLDIQMPGCSGIEVAASLPEPRPHIVFCTAYDQYAVDAFELHAVDYLLKPVNRARLDKALDRIRGQGDDARSPSIDAAGRAAGNFPERFLARRASRHCVVPRADVQLLQTEEGVTLLRTGEDHYWMQPTLTELENRLDPSLFFRVSRSAIVNLDHVREVKPVHGGLGEVTLSNGDSVEVSRRRFKELMEKLGRG